jgi:deoxycytidylate deaminase
LALAKTKNKSPSIAESTADDGKKRMDFINWDEFFMGTAILAAQRSKDPATQVGACIVRENIIVAIGYNGMPIGCPDDEMPWGKCDEDPLKTKWAHELSNLILIVFIAFLSQVSVCLSCRDECHHEQELCQSARGHTVHNNVSLQ